MNRDEFPQVKRVDGIYKSRPVKKGPIQVELSLNDTKNIPVTWKKSTTNLETRTVTESDRFYSIATAALTGTKPPRARLSRLRRSKSSDSPTIGELVRQAEHADEDDQKTRDVFAKKFVTYKNKATNLFTKVYKKVKSHISKHDVVFKQSNQPREAKAAKNSYKTMLILQFVVIIILSSALAVVAQNFNQYRASSAEQMSVQKQQYEQKWAEVEASWKCINEKWNKIQSSDGSSVTSVGEVSC